MKNKRRNILDDLAAYNPITIQCHDNPDADAIASGYGLYMYYQSLGKDVRLIYSGKNTVKKSNLVALISKYNIPIEFVSSRTTKKFSGLLITVDCQYGAGNVTHFEADEVAIIDHHRIEIDNVEKNLILSYLGSCSTIVWKLLKEVGYKITDDNGLGTCLYYGLYTDTNQLAEIVSPVDKDCAEDLPVEKSVISFLRNCNISVEELDVASVAMLRYSFNNEYGFVVVKSKPCDPNILGLIADFMLQVDKFNICVVFNESQDGYKLSVRSCVKEVNACELVQFLTHNIGSGGGHYEKAGGFISSKLYMHYYSNLQVDAYLNNRLVEYFEGFDVVYAKDYEADITTMDLYKKKKVPFGYVKLTDVLPIGTPILIRTLECDMDLVIEDDMYVIIGLRGEVWPNREEKFERAYEKLDEPYSFAECAPGAIYEPKIKNKLTGDNIDLVQYAKRCLSSGGVQIYCKKLDRYMKVFVEWDKERYMLGQPGDRLAVRNDDFHDIYIVEKSVFDLSYELVE